MKTTIEIADPLLESAKAIAAREGITLKALVEEGLRKAVEGRAGDGEFELRDAGVEGRGLQPEAEGRSWQELRELAYGDRRTP